MTNPAMITGIDEDGLVHARYIKPMSEKAETSRRFWHVKERSFPVVNPDGQAVNKGDFIEVSVETGLTIGAAFLVFIVPLLLFILAYGVGGLFIESEGLRVALGLAGLGVGLVLPAGINLLKKEKSFPRLERKLTPAQAMEAMGCEGCESCGGCG